MATQESDDPLAFPVQGVANAFVGLYYRALYADPDNVHKFYKDTSTITRPNLIDGEMTSASTMLGIKDKILSLEYHKYRAEITSINAQESGNGITVFVTGFLIIEGGRSFTQFFVLAPIQTGYFVLNDVFMFGVATEVTETRVTTFMNEGNQESAQDPNVAYYEKDLKEKDKKIKELKDGVEVMKEKIVKLEDEIKEMKEKLEEMMTMIETN